IVAPSEIFLMARVKLLMVAETITANSNTERPCSTNPHPSVPMSTEPHHANGNARAHSKPWHVQCRTITLTCGNCRRSYQRQRQPCGKSALAGARQTCCRACKYCADGIRQFTHRGDCCQADQKNEQTVFHQVLPFFFVPKPLQKTRHVPGSSVLFSLVGHLCRF